MVKIAADGREEHLLNAHGSSEEASGILLEVGECFGPANTNQISAGALVGGKAQDQSEIEKSGRSSPPAAVWQHRRNGYNNA